MPSNIRIIIIFLALTFLSFVGKTQSLNINDLFKLTSQSPEEASNYLVKDKQFKALTPIKVYGRTVSQFIKESSLGKELIVKNEWLDGQVLRASVHYDLPVTNVNALIEGLKSLSFSLASKEKDKNKEVWLYESKQYTVSIYIFSNDKVPASIEVHTK